MMMTTAAAAPTTWKWWTRPPVTRPPSIWRAESWQAKIPQTLTTEIQVGRWKATGADLPHTLRWRADLPQTLAVPRRQTYRIPFADLPHTFGCRVLAVTSAMQMACVITAYLAYLGPYPNGQDVSEKVSRAEREQSSRSGVKHAFGRRTPSKVSWYAAFSQGVYLKRLMAKAWYPKVCGRSAKGIRSAPGPNVCSRSAPQRSGGSNGPDTGSNWLFANSSTGCYGISTPVARPGRGGRGPRCLTGHDPGSAPAGSTSRGADRGTDGGRQAPCPGPARDRGIRPAGSGAEGGVAVRAGADDHEKRSAADQLREVVGATACAPGPFGSTLPRTTDAATAHPAGGFPADV